MKKPAMFLGTALAAAALCWGAWEPLVSLASLKAVEASMNDRLRSSINDPYDLLGPARGTYLDGYGAVFTVELNLVYVSPLNLSPFKPTISEKELTELHDRKSRKVEVLKAAMRDLMTGASKTLTGLPPDQRIVMEAFFFNYRWEQTRGLPHRLALVTTRQKLLDATAKRMSPADMAALFEEEEM
ncbi:MAG: hypothetical protein KGN84_17030 [Acidobacteriota bacterium]|nr:hypothetical protein [Acidobacteriota bacterium]